MAPGRSVAASITGQAFTGWIGLAQTIGSIGSMAMRSVDNPPLSCRPRLMLSVPRLPSSMASTVLSWLDYRYRPRIDRPCGVCPRRLRPGPRRYLVQTSERQESVHITWYPAPPTPAQWQAWHWLWKRLLVGNRDRLPKKEQPSNGGSRAISATVTSGRHHIWSEHANFNTSDPTRR